MGKFTKSNLSAELIAEIEAMKSPSKSSYTLGNVVGLAITSANSKVSVSWSDPLDLTVTADDGTKVSLVKWAGTKLVYKAGSYPTNVNDGTLATDSKVRDQYKTNGFVIDGLIQGTTYYFMLFPYSTDDVYTVDAANRASKTVVYDLLGNVSGLTITSNKDVATIKWTDPNDVYRTINGSQVLTAKWAGTKLVRKEGSVPTSETDGTLVVDSKVKNAYSSTGYNDSGLVDKKTYFYKLFPYSTDNGVTNDNTNSGSVTIKIGDDTSGSPGGSTLVAGTTNAGFFGEVAASSFITGDALALQIGLSSGTSQFSNEPWLKFMLDGKILFVAKKPFRHSISWDNINSANAVNGSKTITIGGNTYKVRLFRGAQNNPAIQSDADRDAIGSEWNRLMLPIHVDAPNSWKIGGSSNTIYGGMTEDWNINYTDQDLHTHNDYGNGTHSWCQETASSDTSSRVTRGISGVSDSYWYTSYFKLSDFGWRPVLELVQAQ